MKVTYFLYSLSEGVCDTNIRLMIVCLFLGASLVSEDRRGRQIAHYASMRNHKKILQYLFDQRVDLDCRCHLDKTPVHYAAHYGCM